MAAGPRGGVPGVEGAGGPPGVCDHVAAPAGPFQEEEGGFAYDDGDGARKEEIASMSGSTVFSSFYDQLKSVREYHRKFPGEPSTESAETTLLAAVLETAPE